MNYRAPSQVSSRDTFMWNSPSTASDYPTVSNLGSRYRQSCVKAETCGFHVSPPPARAYHQRFGPSSESEPTKAAHKLNAHDRRLLDRAVHVLPPRTLTAAPKSKEQTSVPDMSRISLDDADFPALGSAVRHSPTEVTNDLLSSPVRSAPVRAALEYSRPYEISSEGIYRHRDAIPKSQQGTTLDFETLLVKSSQTTKKKGHMPNHAAGEISQKDHGGRIPTLLGPGGNALDSTAPSKFRGKESEKPKPKKLSALKKAIVQTREQRDQAKAALDAIPSENGIPAAPDEDEPPSNNAQSAVEESLNVEPASEPKDLLHNRRFRSYCDQIQSKEINELTGKILDILVHYQDRSFHQQDPAKFKKRFVCGLKDVAKRMGVREIRMVIIAPDVESADQPKGLDPLINKIKSAAEEQNIPVVYAMKRYTLGKRSRKPNPVSTVGILSYDVANTEVKQLLELVKDARQDYATRLANLGAVPCGLEIEDFQHPL